MGGIPRWQHTLQVWFVAGVLVTRAAWPASPAATDSSTANEGPTPPAATHQDESVFALPTTRDHIGRVVVAAKVNGQGPFRFIVDTGATYSTVSPELVRVLGLHPADVLPLVVNGITGTAQVTAVTLDTLQTGDLTIASLVAPVVWAPVMAGADGIFGAAGLTEKSLSVDFERNRVLISRGVEPALRAQATRIHATGVTHGLMTLESRIGGVRTIAVIDTGSERTLGNFALRDALQARRRTGAEALVTTVYGATEQVERGEILEAPPIVIDALRINDVEVVYGDFHIFSVWQMQHMPAIIIGMDVLGTVASLGIDFKNRDVYFTNSRLTQEKLAPGGNMGAPVQRK